MPDCATPPKGATAVLLTPVLMPTMPTFGAVALANDTEYGLASYFLVFLLARPGPRLVHGRRARTLHGRPVSPP